MPARIGYQFGQPFGDPSAFTRSTGEDEIDRFNQWMRSQPWWNPNNPAQIRQGLAAQGVKVPSGFKIDDAGNFNQTNRLGRNLAIGAGIGAAALTGGAALGAFGGAAGGAGGAGAVAPLAGATLPSAAGLTVPGAVTGLGSAAGLGAAGAGGGSVGIGSTLAGLGRGLGNQFRDDPLGTLGRIGDLGRGGAQSQADSRRSDAEIEARNAQINNQSNLAAGEFNINAGSRRLGQVANADQLANIEDFAWVRDAQGNIIGSTGGRRPSNFGPNTRQGAQELSKQGLSALMSGSDQLTPQQASLPESGLGERILGTTGIVGNVADAVSGRAGGGPPASLQDEFRRRSQELARLSGPQGPQVPQRPGQPDTRIPFGNVRF